MCHISAGRSTKSQGARLCNNKKGATRGPRRICGQNFYQVTWGRTQKSLQSNQPNLMYSLKTNDQNQYNNSIDIAFVIPFSKTGAYINHNATTIKCHHWRKCIRVHAASSETRKNLYITFFHISQYYSLRPLNTLNCVKLVELPFNVWPLVLYCAKMWNGTILKPREASEKGKKNADAFPSLIWIISRLCFFLFFY